MKYYNIRPTMKKSVVEFEIYRKGNKEEGFQYATKELGWRSGDFTIFVPETSEEIDTCIGNRPEGQWTREDVDDYIAQGGNPFMPSKDDTFIELEEYEWELDNTWDGCWEEWSVQGEGIEDEESLIDELTEAYNENYDEGLAELGWDQEEFFVEIHCAVEITEVDDPYEIDVKGA